MAFYYLLPNLQPIHSINNICIFSFDFLTLFFLLILYLFLILFDFTSNTQYSYENSPPLINLFYLVIVNSKLTKQYLVLVLRKCPLQSFMSLSLSQSPFLDEGPEGRIVQVVYMAVDLSP